MSGLSNRKKYRMVGHTILQLLKSQWTEQELEWLDRRIRLHSYFQIGQSVSNEP